MSKGLGSLPHVKTVSFVGVVNDVPFDMNNRHADTPPTTATGKSMVIAVVTKDPGAIAIVDTTVPLLCSHTLLAAATAIDKDEHGAADVSHGAAPPSTPVVLT